MYLFVYQRSFGITAVIPMTAGHKPHKAINTHARNNKQKRDTRYDTTLQSAISSTHVEKRVVSRQLAQIWTHSVSPTYARTRSNIWFFLFPRALDTSGDTKCLRKGAYNMKIINVLQMLCKCIEFVKRDEMRRLNVRWQQLTELVHRTLNAVMTQVAFKISNVHNPRLGSELVKNT